MKIEVHWTVWGIGVMAGSGEGDTGLAVFIGPFLICIGKFE